MPSLGKEAISTRPAASQDSETTYELKNSSIRESKNHRADVFTGYPRKLRIPCRDNGDILPMKEMRATSKVKPVTQNSKEHLKSKEI